MNSEDLFAEFDILVRNFRDAQGSSADSGDAVFFALERAMTKNGGGAHWEFLEGFLRRCK